MRWPPSDRGVDVLTIPVNVPPGGGLVFNGGGRLLGWLLDVTGAVAASLVTLSDGVDGNGDPLGQIETGPLGTAYASIGFPGWPLETGLFIGNVSAMTGTVIIGVDR